MLVNRFYELLAGLLPVRKINQLAKRRTPSVGVLERLEDRVVMTVDVWTGASSNLWSDNGNWQDNSAPMAGEDLVFPSTATNKTAVYDSGLGVSSFGSIEIQGSGYDISTSFASLLTLTSGISATYGSSISNFDIDFDTGNGTVSVGSGGTLELGGVISGTSGLNVSGGGTLQVAGTSSNIFTGSTIVSSATTLVLDKSNAIAVPGALSISAGGTVQLTQSDQIADASSVTAGTGATLDLNNFDDTIGTLDLTGSTVSTGTGTITLGGNVTTNSDSNTSVISGNLDLGGATRTFTVANNAQLDPDLSITANISGTGAGLIKAGANSQLRLSGNSTYDGTTTITAGAIEIASDNALGSSSAGTVVNSGFSLALLGDITVPEPITISGVGFGGLGAVFNGSGNNTISGAITLASNSTIGSLSGTLTVSGAISDGASSFALTKVCAGTVTLTSANTYDGGTTITTGLNGSGVLAITNGSALGTGSVSISSGSELDLSNDITLSRNISFAGSGVGGNGALRSVSGNNVYSGTASVQANNTRIKVDAGQLEFNGDLTDNSNNYSLDKFGAGVMLVSGNLTSTLIVHAVEGDVRVTGSDSSIITLYGGTVSGTGTVGALDHAGNSFGTINPGTGGSTTGTLTTGDGFQIGSTGTLHIDIGGTTAGTTYDQIANSTSGSVDITGSTLEVALVNGFIPSIGDIFTIIDKQNIGGITGTFNNLAEGDTFQLGNITYQISYTGGNGNDVTLTVVGIAYTWTGLGGDSNWTTGANWDIGTAPVPGVDLVFPVGAARTTNNNDFGTGTDFNSITFDAAGYNVQGNSVRLANGVDGTLSSGTSTFTPDIILTGSGAFDVAAGGHIGLGSSISGNFGLNKSGPGDLILLNSSNDTYTGSTTINAGVLQVDGTIASAVVLAGGTLTGSGTVNGSGISGSAGTVDPGTVGGAGILTYANATGLTLPTPATFHIDLDGSTAGTGYDQLRLTNASALFNPNGAILDVDLGYTPSINTSFQIVSQAYGSPITGRFNGISQFGSFTVDRVTFSVGYFNSGVILTVTHVDIPTYTWTGLGGDSNWSTAANWDTNVAPIGGEDLVFPNGAARQSNTNDLSSKSFHSITIAAGDYDINGNAITLTNGLSYSSSSGTAEFHPDITLTGTETVYVADGGDFIISGAISGSGFGITKTGGGTLEYTGFSANTYTGTTTVEAGMLILNRASGLSAIAGNLVIGDNIGGGESVQVGSSNQIADDSTVTVNEGATFDLSSSTDMINSLTLQGASVTVSSGGVLGISSIITSNVATTHATSTISGAGTLALSNSFGTLLPITVAQDVNANVDLRIGTSITGINRGIQKLGDGTLALSGTGSTYDNNTSAEAGILQIEADNALGNTNTVVVATGGSINFAGANLSIDRGINVASGAGFNGGNAIGVVSGATTLSGPIGLFADIQIGAASGSTLTITGSISQDIDPPYFNLTVSNGPEGRTILGGDNSGSFRGNVDVLSGFLQVANGSALGQSAVSTNVTVQSSATLELAGGITLSATKTIAVSGLPVANFSKIMSLSGDNTILGDIPITGGNNESFDVAGGTTLTVAGVISGSLDFDKNNTGTLILTGTNANTGNVNVGNGTLLVNGSLATSNSLFVDGIVGGTGTLPAVTVSSIGTLSPGNSPGTIHSGALAFSDSGSTYLVELNGAAAGTEYDQTDVTGTVTLANATLSISLGYIPAVGNSFTIINNDGVDAINGAFNGLAEGSTITIGQVGLTISYVGGDGNDVVLTVTSVIFIWDGGGADANWTTAANWVGDVTPNAGTDLVFPVGADRISNTNDLASGTAFHSITIAAADYNLSGNGIGLVNGITTTYAGTATVGLAIDLSADQAFNIGAGSTLVDSGTLSGSGLLTKSGTGTLLLQGLNTYSGGTTVAAGNLGINNNSSLGSGNVLNQAEIDVTNNLLLNNNFTVDSSGTAFVIDGLTTIQGTFTLLADTTIQKTDYSNLYLNGVIDGGFGLISTGNGTLGLGQANTYTGGTTIHGGFLQVFNSQATGTVGTVALDSGTTLIDTTTTYDLPSGGLTLADGSTFLVPLPNAQTVTGPIAVTGQPTLYVAEDGDLSVTGVISGSGGFKKTGGGEVFLSGINTYDGTTIVEAGLLRLTGSATLGSTTGETIIDDDAVLSFNVTPQSTIAEPITAGSAGGTAIIQQYGGPFTLSGDITLNSNLRLDVQGATLTLSGDISDGAGQFGIAKQFADLVLSGTNTYDGSTNIISGSLYITNPSALGSTVGGTVLRDGGVLAFETSGNNTISEAITLGDNGGQAYLNNVSGNNVLTGAITLAATGNLEGNGGTLELSGLISDGGAAYGLKKLGGSDVTISHANTFDGTVDVTQGDLIVSDVGALGSTLAGTNIGANGRLVFNLSGQIAEAINFTAPGATLKSAGVDAILSGPVSLTGNDIIDISTGGSLLMSGDITGTGGFEKQGSGILILSGTNDFQGDTLLSAGQTTVRSNSALSTTDVTISDGAFLDLDGWLDLAAGSLTVSGNGTGNGAVVSSSGNSTYSGPVIMVANTTIGTLTGTSVTLSGIISGTANLTKSGQGQLILAGSNTFAGNVTAADGSLQASNSNAFGDPTVASTVSATTGATLELSGGITLPATKSVSLSGIPAAGASKITNLNNSNSIQGNLALSGGNNESIDVASGTTLTLTGIISGTLDLDKNGNGTLILTGISTLTGQVNVGAGTLLVNGQLSTPSLVFVDGILGGSGTVGNVSVSSIGTLSPGNSPGIITTGDLSLTAGSTFSVELNGVTAGTEYDQANVTGTVTLTGATLSMSLGFTPAVDDEFTIINNDNNDDPIVGTFAGLPEGSSLAVGGVNFIISYVGGDGNDVVLSVNEAPTAIGLSNSSIQENAPSGSLVGTFNTTDPDTGDTFIYTLVAGDGGDDNSSFTIDPSGNLLTADIFDYETKSSYTVRVRSTDAGGLSTEQDFLISILALNDNAPLFSSSATFNLVENTTAVGTVIATDADVPVQTVTYSITGGADSALFSIDAATGVLTFNTAPNYELPTDSGTDNVYNVEVTANDDSGSTTAQNIAVTVTPINDNAPLFSSSATFNVVENTTAVGTVIATDADVPVQTVTYSITGGADSALFSIDAATGVLTFNAAPNYELPTDSGADNVYNVEVTANDDAGSTTVQNIAVTVTPINDNAPLFSSSATFNVVENTTAVGTVIATDADVPVQTVTYSITGGADSALFSIDAATGVLTFNTAPNYELPTDSGADNVYNVEVTAIDDSGSTTVQNIAVTVTPINDNAPLFSSSATFNVVENTTAVGTVIATDADVPVQTVNYSITGGADAAKFTINPSTGVLAFNTAPDYENPTDVGTDNVYDVDVTANDNSGLTTVQSIAVTVLPVNDNGPIFTSPSIFTVAENLTVVGSVSASDTDHPGQTIAYSITGGLDAALFTINPSTGQLSFLVASDYEHPTDVGANNTYEVQVTANDGSGSTTAQDLTVNVTNVVEQPIITLNPADGTYLLGKENAYVDPSANYQADVTETDYSAAKLTVSITVNRQPKDILSINPQGNKPGQINLKGKNVLYGGVVIGTFQGGTRSKPNLVITFNSSASEAAVQALVKRITFFSKNERNASHASRTVQMQITNVSGHDSNQATRVINILGAV